MKKLLTILAALILLGCQGLNEPDPNKPEPKPDPATAEITIEVTGTLSELLKRYDLPSITTLRLRGIMNYDDFEAVKSLRNLVTLDIENIENVEIPEFALSECTLTNIILPKNLKKICSSAFSRCPSLTSITIPASVETIEAAFFKCPKLASVTFDTGSKLTYLDGFESCDITSITIPASVETIEIYSFSGCSKLASVTFEAGSKLKTIGSKPHSIIDGAFTGCSSLTSITIPASVETIYAFSGCAKLASVTFEAGSKLKTIGGFLNCTSLTSITIPASVETVDAFSGCSNLTSVTFEAGSKLETIDGFSNCTSLMTVDASKCELITTIGFYTFNDCGALKLFKIGTVIPPTCGEMTFSSSNRNCVLQVPSGSVNAYKAASRWKDSFATITALD